MILSNYPRWYWSLFSTFFEAKHTIFIEKVARRITNRKRWNEQPFHRNGSWDWGDRRQRRFDRSSRLAICLYCIDIGGVSKIYLLNRLASNGERDPNFQDPSGSETVWGIWNLGLMSSLEHVMQNPGCIHLIGHYTNPDTILLPQNRPYLASDPEQDLDCSCSLFMFIYLNDPVWQVPNLG